MAIKIQIRNNIEDKIEEWEFRYSKTGLESSLKQSLISTIVGLIVKV